MILRPTARVFLLDEHDRLLLFQFADDSISSADDAGNMFRPGVFWATPGGGVEPEESYESAAIREVREETGIVLKSLGPCIFERDKVLTIGAGNQIHFVERYFVARSDTISVSYDAHEDLERSVIRQHRWWSLGELEVTTEIVFPEQITETMRRAITIPF